jgi:hypothetical protein
MDMQNKKAHRSKKNCCRTLNILWFSYAASQIRKKFFRHLERKKVNWHSGWWGEWGSVGCDWSQ